jgi:hypothetical protein
MEIGTMGQPITPSDLKALRLEEKTADLTDFEDIGNEYSFH